INNDPIEPHDGPSTTRKTPEAQFFTKQEGAKWDIEFDFANQASVLHPLNDNPWTLPTGQPTVDPRTLTVPPVDSTNPRAHDDKELSGTMTDDPSSPVDDSNKENIPPIGHQSIVTRPSTPFPSRNLEPRAPLSTIFEDHTAESPTPSVCPSSAGWNDYITRWVNDSSEPRQTPPLPDSLSVLSLDDLTPDKPLYLFFPMPQLEVSSIATSSNKPIRRRAAMSTGGKAPRSIIRADVSDNDNDSDPAPTPPVRGHSWPETWSWPRPWCHHGFHP
ncbi:hypothetical protein LXA43DRAFT_1105779, partial [Ganoderma leucocontextum]